MPKITEFRKQKIRSYWTDLCRLWWDVRKGKPSKEQLQALNVIEGRMTAVRTVLFIVAPEFESTLQYPNRQP